MVGPLCILPASCRGLLEYPGNKVKSGTSLGKQIDRHQGASLLQCVADRVVWMCRVRDYAESCDAVSPIRSLQKMWFGLTSAVACCCRYRVSPLHLSQYGMGREMNRRCVGGLLAD